MNGPDLIDDVAMTWRQFRGMVWFALLCVIAAFTIGALMFMGDQSATIGDNQVPSGLNCEEDEVIGFDPSEPGPRSLTCVHIEAVNNGS